ARDRALLRRRRLRRSRQRWALRQARGRRARGVHRGVVGGLLDGHRAVVAPLFVTNLLWFTAIDRVGPSRASLFSNIQPFVGVVFAILLLGEHLSRWEIAGGVVIAGGIVAERRSRLGRRTPELQPTAD